MIGRAQISRSRLVLALVAGAVAGALGMAIVPLVLVSGERSVQGFIDVGLSSIWFAAFTLPIAFLVGVPSFISLRSRDLLGPTSVCITGLLAGLVTMALMYGISGQPIHFGFLMRGGFGGLVAGAVCSLVIFRRSNHSVEPDARGSP